MLVKSISIAISTVLSLSAGAVAAEQSTYAPGNEPNVSTQTLPRSEPLAKTQNKRNEATGKTSTFHGWRYVGGDTGWELVQHAYEFRNGTWVHADKGDQETQNSGQVSFEQARNPTAAAKYRASTDAWRYVGGDTGWELVQHAYDFRSGQLVHVDQIDHSTLKPSLASIERGRKAYQDLYAGG